MMTSLKYSPDKYSNPQNSVSRLNDTIFTKQMLRRLNKYQDEQEVTLEQSIPILYELNIFQQLTSIPDAKKRLSQESKPNNRLQLEARFVYNLWKMIGNETISMGYFKQIITLFITQEISQLANKLEQIFQDQADLLVQILAIWQAMLENHIQPNQQQDYKQSSVLTEDQANFNESPQYNSYNNRSSGYSGHHFSTNRNRPTTNERQKQSQRQIHSQNNRGVSERYNSKSRRQNIQQVTDEVYLNNLYQLPVLSVEKQKDLINRLYVVNKYDRYQELKKIQDEEKILKQMQQCTFRPNIDKNKKQRPSTGNKVTSRTQSKPIPGFQKAIERMKTGQQKTKQLKEKLQLRSNNNNSRQFKLENSKVFVPPKFLARQMKKEEKKILFTIQFDIGRHKLTCKIHENQSAEQLARNIQSIYSLKQESYEQIKTIIQQEMERYFSLNNGQNEDHEQEDQN